METPRLRSLQLTHKLTARHRQQAKFQEGGVFDRTPLCPQGRCIWQMIQALNKCVLSEYRKDTHLLDGAACGSASPQGVTLPGPPHPGCSPSWPASELI